MKKHSVNSSNLNSAATRAIFALLFFGLSYILLLLLSIALSICCGYLGIALISLKLSGITLGLGIGLIGLGILVFFFLVKFIFKKHVVDRSSLVELEESDAPLLYREIEEIVSKVKTSFPKKIYLSADVNAGVFYDSTFLSLFLPVKKNLQIGLGLVNSVSAEELKAILAHEFGHFSQRTMKIGSYAYSVNQVIINLLFDNDGYHRTVRTIGEISGYFSLFVAIGMKIIQGIQWILVKLYGLVNINYLGLSREMEFHADAVAVSTVGTKPFISSLLRLDLASNAYNQLLAHYEQHIDLGIKPTNIYPQQKIILNLLAEEQKIEVVNGLPMLSLETYQKYNYSKIVIKDQWASHPSTIDRIDAIKRLKFHEGSEDGRPAAALFAAIENLEQMVTEVLFSTVTYQKQTSCDSLEEFIEEFTKNRKVFKFPEVFNGYYDCHSPGRIDLDHPHPENTIAVGLGSFFSDDKVGLVYSLRTMRADLEFLKELKLNGSHIKSFEYDGVKYGIEQIDSLLPSLAIDIQETDAKLLDNDLQLYQYFKQNLNPDEFAQFKSDYKNFLTFEAVYREGSEICEQIIKELQFTHVTTPFSEIAEKFETFKANESKLKRFLDQLLVLEAIALVEKDSSLMQEYLSSDLIYFVNNAYVEVALAQLYRVLDLTANLLNDTYYRLKGILLEDMERLDQQMRRTERSALSSAL